MTFLEKELLFEGKEKATSVNIKEFAAESAKLDITAAGIVTGKVDGIIMTTHNVLMKADGAEVDFRSIIFSNGEPVFLWGKATGKAIDPAPIMKLEENMTFKTPSQRLAYLNTAKGWADGLYNLGTGEYTFKVYALK